MGDDDERDADLALDLLQFDLHLLAQFEIQCAERLVEQQHPRPSDQRPGQRDALTLSARQLRGAARRVAGQPHHVERVGGAAPALGLGHALDLQPVLDVLCDRHVREQGVLLEDGVDVAAARGQRGDVDAAEFDHAGRRLLEPRDHPQHRRLARTRRPEDREQLAVADGQVGALDGHHVTENLADTDQLDLWIVNGGSGIRIRLRADRPRGHGHRRNSTVLAQLHRGFRDLGRVRPLVSHIWRVSPVTPGTSWPRVVAPMPRRRPT